jgi:hypothetical protein
MFVERRGALSGLLSSPDFSSGGTEHRGVSLKSVFRRDA